MKIKEALPLRLTPVQTILLASVFLTFADNWRLFQQLAARVDLVSVKGLHLLLLVVTLMVSLFGLVFVSLGHRRLLKPLLVAVFIGTAVLSYFTSSFGIVFDREMIRNIHENMMDRNTQEAGELFSLSLVTHVFLFGIVPATLLSLVSINFKPIRQELRSRAICLGCLVGALATLVLVNFKTVSFFARENKDLRSYANPFYAIDSTQKYIRRELRSRAEEKFTVIGADATRRKTSKTRLVGIMVVGETARADHFSLDGYPRITNPLLAKRDVINFKRVTSSGTATAYSVPAMFSLLAPRDYSPEKAKKQSNLLDVIAKAGVKVIWIDNNSSSKNVADRVEYVSLRSNPDPASPLYSDGGYFDEELVRTMERTITESSGDLLIVLHTMGSHGPTYHKRFPKSFAKFTPYCEEAAPHNCNDEEVINAYDNTILYTDYILDMIVGYLDAHGADYDSFMLYASDHGESLGENGVYLHGLPNLIAPEAQRHVPMILWMSTGCRVNNGIVYAALRSQEETPLSHTNIPHSLLGLFEVLTTAYNPACDIINAGRGVATGLLKRTDARIFADRSTNMLSALRVEHALSRSQGDPRISPGQ